MRSQFPLFQSHLDVAHSYWKSIVKNGDIVIDATCGNGNDTLFLAQLALEDTIGTVYAIDKQSTAIENTANLLKLNLGHRFSRVHFIEGCHSTFPNNIKPHTVKLIVYNLGYLPGGDKKITSRVSQTLESIANALPLIAKGGAISITCYPGHEEGKTEETALIDWANKLNPQIWQCTHQRWINRNNAPSFLLMQHCCSDSLK